MDNIFGYKITDSKYSHMKIIETPKFILRPAEISDVPDFYEYFSQEKVVKYLPFKAHKYIGDTRKFIQSFFIDNYEKGRVGNYAIYHKKDKKVIGNVGLNNVRTKCKQGEIGICINPKYWGDNLGTEMALLAVITGFELMNMNKIIALTYSTNKYTSKPLEDLRFRYIKTYKPKENIQESRRFEITREEYLILKEKYLPKLIREFK